MDPATTDLLDLRQLGAVYDPGLTGVSHHWNLMAGDGEDAEEIGHTVRTFKGRGILGRVWSSTGLDANNDILADVVDAHGEVRLKVRSSYGGDTKIWDPQRTLIGTMKRAKKEGPTFFDPAGEVVLRIEGRGEADGGWHDVYALVDAAGTDRGALTGIRPVKAQYSLIDDLIGLDTWSRQRAYENTQHHGFRSWKEYWVTLDDQPMDEPLRTFVVLAPVLCGYSY